MTEFKTVMREFQRLCSGRKCGSCPIGIYNESALYCSVWVKNHSEEAERIIMEWSAAHPIKTNGMKFKEVFGYRFADKIKTPEDIMTWLCEEYKRGQDNG